MSAESLQKYCPRCHAMVRPVPDLHAVPRVFVVGVVLVFVADFIISILAPETQMWIYLALSLSLLVCVFILTRSVYRRRRVCPMCRCPSRYLLDEAE